MTTGKIIEFYKHAEAEANKPFESGLYGRDIVELLRKGEYTPDPENLDHKDWENFLFFIPKNPRGVMV